MCDIVDSILERFSPSLLNILRFDGTTITAEIRDGFVDVAPLVWDLRGTAEVDFLLADYGSLSKSSEHAWVNGSIWRCRYSALAGVLLTNLFARKTKGWRSVGLRMLQQVAILIEQPGNMESWANYQPTTEELTEETLAGNARIMDVELKRRIVQLVVSGKVIVPKGFQGTLPPIQRPTPGPIRDPGDRPPSRFGPVYGPFAR